MTAAAIACLFSAGEYKDELRQEVVQVSARPPFPLGGGGGVRIGHDEYTHYYYAQAIYFLGDDGWDKMFGPAPANSA